MIKSGKEISKQPMKMVSQTLYWWLDDYPRDYYLFFNTFWNYFKYINPLDISWTFEEEVWCSKSFPKLYLLCNCNRWPMLILVLVFKRKPLFMFDELADYLQQKFVDVGSGLSPSVLEKQYWISIFDVNFKQLLFFYKELILNATSTKLPFKKLLTEYFFRICTTFQTLTEFILIQNVF